MLRQIRKWLESRRAPSPQARALALIRAVVDPCPFCGVQGSLHAWFDLAMVEADTKLERHLEGLVARSAWTEVADARTVNCSRNIRVWRVYRCPSGEMLLATIFSPVDMWQDDRVERVTELKETGTIAGIVGQRWKPLSETTT